MAMRRIVAPPKPKLTPPKPKPTKKSTATAAITSASRPIANAAAARQIDAITVKVAEVLRSWSRGDAQSRIELGALLGNAKSLLPRGEWLSWVDDHVPYAIRSVQIFMDMSAWSKANPDTWDRIAGLGPAKLAILVRLPPTSLALLLSRREHIVPSSGRRTTLEGLKFPEFKEVIRALKRKPAPEPDPVAHLMKTIRRAHKQFVQTLHQVVDHKKDLPKDFVEALHDDLLDELEAVQNAYGLDAG